MTGGLCIFLFDLKSAMLNKACSGGDVNAGSRRRLFRSAARIGYATCFMMTPFVKLSIAKEVSTNETLGNIFSRCDFDVDELRKNLSEIFTDVEGVVVYKNTHLEFEYYKKGSGPQTLRNIQSVTKSVMSILVGIAIANNYIKSVDQPLLELLPELSMVNDDYRIASITIKHLLTMTSGFKVYDEVHWSDFDNITFALSRPILSSPGANFSYDNIGANLLSIVIQRATGQDVLSFAKKHLFNELDISHIEWRKGANGFRLGSGGLSLRTRDMAKLGQLLAQYGTWNNIEIVPKYFVLDSIRPATLGDPSYGYLWWVDLKNLRQVVFFAHGYGGQYVLVYPSKNIVVAISSKISEASNTRGHAKIFLDSCIHAMP